MQVYKINNCYYCRSVSLDPGKSGASSQPYENSQIEEETFTLKKSLIGSMGSDYLHMQSSVSSDINCASFTHPNRSPPGNCYKSSYPDTFNLPSQTSDACVNSHNASPFRYELDKQPQHNRVLDTLAAANDVKTVALPPKPETPSSSTTVSNMYSEMAAGSSRPPLQRVLSLSAQNLQHPSHAYKNQPLYEETGENYSYVGKQSTSLRYGQDVNVLQRDADDLYARPLSRAMRQSVSMSDMLDTAKQDTDVQVKDKSLTSGDSRQEPQGMVSPISPISPIMKGIHLTNNSRSFRKVDNSIELRKKNLTPNCSRRLPSLPPTELADQNKLATDTTATLC